LEQRNIAKLIRVLVKFCVRRNTLPANTTRITFGLILLEFYKRTLYLHSYNMEECFSQFSGVISPLWRSIPRRSAAICP